MCCGVMQLRALLIQETKSAQASTLEVRVKGQWRKPKDAKAYVGFLLLISYQV